jgi:hypothetical protein
MTATNTRWIKMLLGAAGLLLAAVSGHADGPAYKCGRNSYSSVACPGGREIGVPHRRTTDKSKPVPQGRAVIAKRAVLSPEQRQECKALDVRLRDQQAAIKAKADAATLQDEMPLVQSRKRFRELRC